MMELPEEQRSEYASMFMQLEDNPDLADAWNVIQEEAPGATDWAAGKAFGGAKWALGAFSEGLARAYSYITGDSATAAEQVLRSRENREKAKEIMADGIVQYLQDVANEAGVKGNLDPARAKMVKDRLTKGSTLDTAIQKIVEPARAIGTVGFQDLGLREDVRDDPEVVEELRKAGLVMPVPDDSMDAKARRGTGRTAMIEPVRPESTPDPLKSAQTLARLRRTNPEYFIDTPPAVTDGDTASEVAAQARTGGDRAPGLMSRMTPNKPVDIEAEAAPKVGESEFLPLMKRVHGPQSDVVERFSDKVASGKITVADITRLIKSTQGLPKTKSRDTLLASLYEYRDVMNKR
jgi:hypothetical protein